MPRGTYLLFFLFFLILPYALAASCVGISEPTNWEEVKLAKGMPAYFSTTIYNSTSGGDYCDPAYYRIQLRNSGSQLLEEIFDWNVSIDRVFLGNNAAKKVLITLTPKVDSGKYTVLVTAIRENEEQAQQAIISTATARISMIIGDEITQEFAEKPFWTVKKDCPGGLVVRQGEDCPRVCKSGMEADAQGRCPEDAEGQPPAMEEGGEVAPTGFFALGGFSIEMIVAFAAIIIAIAVMVFSFLYIQQLKKEIRGGRL